LNEETPQRGISDTAFLVENSVLDKTELNIQDSLLSSKENILCQCSPSYKVLCEKNVDTLSTENHGNLFRLEEKALNTVNSSMDVIEKYDEIKDTKTLPQGVKSKLVQKICSSGSSIKGMNQYNSFRGYTSMKSPDSGMNDFMENSVALDFGNSSPLVGSVSAGLTVSRKLFHDDTHKGFHAELEGLPTQCGVASAQLKEDNGAVACDEVSHVGLSGSVDAVKCSVSNPAASNEIEVVAATSTHSFEDFPQDLSISTLEEVCQVTELLAASTNTLIECSQDVVSTNKISKTPVCVQLPLSDKSCLCRTSTPIAHTDKHRKFDCGTKKKRIKFVNIPGNETPKNHRNNARLVKENIEKKYDLEERLHGSDSVQEQATAEFKSSENNSAVDIALRVQTIKMTGNKIKKFMYAPDSMRMKATLTRNKNLNILMEDVIKSAQAMENVVKTKAKHNDMGKFNSISIDRQELITFCKLQESSRFVTGGGSVEDLKKINATTNRADGNGKHVLSLRSCNNPLTRGSNNEGCSTEKKLDQAVSLINQDNIKELINAGGCTNAECSDISSIQCDFETCGSEEQSRAFIINFHDARKFELSNETEEPFNVSDITFDIKEHFRKQLDVLPSSKKKEMESEFSRLSQSTKILGFSTATGKQIKLSNDAVLKAKRLMDDMMVEEMVKVVPNVTSNIPEQNPECEELRDTKVSAVCPVDNDISCKYGNGTAEDKCDVSDNVSRQRHILNKISCHVINPPMICPSSNNKKATVIHAETETYQNYNSDEAVTEENTLSLLGNKGAQANMMTDSQMVLAAEHVELMQQLVDDGSIFSEWPSDVHDQETEKCGKINNSPTEPKYHVTSCAEEGSVSARQKGICASTHVGRDPLNDISMSNIRYKHSYGKLTSLCASGHQDVETSEQVLQQARHIHEKNFVHYSTEREEKETNTCHEVVQNMKSSHNEVKPHSEDVYMEEILNDAVIRHLFSVNLDTYKIENRVQTATNKPENDILNVDHSLLATLNKNKQNEQSEMAGFNTASRENIVASDILLQRTKSCFPKCDATNELMNETVLSESERNLCAINQDMATKINTAELSRAIGRSPVISDGALKSTILSSGPELQKSETNQTVDLSSDTESNKVITVNTVVSEPGLLGNMGENEEMSKILVSINDSSFQEPVTNTRHLFEAESAKSLQHPKFNDQRVEVCKPVVETAENLCSSFRSENHLQLFLPQSVTTDNCQPVSVWEGNVDISDHLCVDNVVSPVLQGFAAASGKQFSVSEALTGAKRLFSSKDSGKDDHGTESSKMKEMNEKGSLSFKTSKPLNNVHISEALSNSSHVISEADTTTFKHQTESRELKERGKQKLPLLQGFKTASRKKVCTSMSDKALNRAMLLISEKGMSPEHEIVTSELRKSNKESSTVLQGFSTANGKRVHVSAKALNRAKLLFSEEEVNETEVPELKQTEESHQSVFQGFSAASGKKVPVSAMALDRAKLLFSEEEFCAELISETEVPELKQKEELHPPVFQGFSTASGKKLPVSAMALNKAKLLFSEEENCAEVVNKTEVPELKQKEEPHPPVFQGFSTANGKKVSVSATALNKAKWLFLEEESCTELVNKTEVPELKQMEEPDSSVFQGFLTASRKKVSVSATTLNRAKLLFSEEESCTELVNETEIPELKQKEELHAPVFQGFSTSSGKEMSISATALNEAKLLFSGEESCTELVNKTEVPELKQMEEPDPSVVQGFSTASGKKVSVSATALNRAKLLLSEEESCTELVNETEVPELKEKEEPHPPVFQGFSTASGKKVSVSATALDRAKLLFSEEEFYTQLNKDETEVPELKQKEVPDSPILQGFSTASGKKVSVSATALDRAKLLFSEEEFCTQLNKDETEVPELKQKEVPDLPVLQGFSTASGKKVSVSATALDRAKLLFSEEESCTELIKDGIDVPELKQMVEPHSPVLQGFSTASRKRVSVSATALNRARVLFSEVETACTKEDIHEGDSSDLNVKKEMISQILQRLSTTSRNSDSVAAEVLNKNTQFGLEELDVCIITSNTNCLESEKSLISETSPQLEKVSVSKEKPRKVKLKLSRRFSSQNESNSSFKSTQSEEINKQNTCISEEACPEAGTLNRFTNTPDFQRKLHHNSSTKVHSHSTATTGTEVIKGKETDDSVIGTPPLDFVTKECSKTDNVSMSLTQEVKESAAALLAHEAIFDSPAWIVSYVSCPDMIYDQDTARAPLVCSEDKGGGGVTVVEPGSPVLGSHDRCRKRRRLKMISDDLGHNSRIPASSSFKVNHYISDS
jgi:hypothetical protein